jgi:thiamine biosynthesis lipoprotein
VLASLGEARWEIWSTTVVLRLCDPRGLSAARAAVTRELAAIELACSRFREDSEIAAVNAARGRAVRVGPLLADALELALRAARLTDGDVDPTVGSALTLAGYDRDWRLLETAPRAASAEGTDDVSSPGSGPWMRSAVLTPPAAPTLCARRVHGWRSVAFERMQRTVRVPAGVQLDLGATAKAWAADRGAQAAARAAGCGALLAIGGDIATSGPAPARGWAVHVTDDHRAGHRAPGQTVTIRSGGLATSSTAVRRWRHRKRTMHHLIDPATGAPVRGTWRTVSVAAASCADANIATTCALVRAGEAPAWLSGLGVPARLVSESGRVCTVGAWPTVGVWPADRAPERSPEDTVAMEMCQQ